MRHLWLCDRPVNDDIACGYCDSTALAYELTSESARNQNGAAGVTMDASAMTGPVAVIGRDTFSPTRSAGQQLLFPVTRDAGEDDSVSSL